MRRACRDCMYVCLYGHVTKGCDHKRVSRMCTHSMPSYGDDYGECRTHQIRQLTQAEEAAVALGGPDAICYSLPVPLVVL